MRCTIPKDRLSASMAVMSHGGATGRLDPALGGRITVRAVRRADGGGALVCEATDGEIAARHVTPATVEQEGVAVVPGRQFADVVRALRDDVVSLALAEGRLAVRAGKQHFRVVATGDDTAPPMPAVDFGAAVAIQGSVLADLIADTRFAVAEPNDGRAALRGALWEVKGSGMEFVGTNGHRLAWSKAQLAMEGAGAACLAGRAVVPGPALEAIGDVFGEAGAVLVSRRRPAGEATGGEAQGEVAESGYLGFQTAAVSHAGRIETTLYVRLIGEPYPDWRRVLPKPQEITREAILETAPLRAAVEGVMVMATDKAKRVIVSLNGSARITADTPDAGDAGDEVPLVSYSGDEMRIGFNGSYLLDTLRHVHTPFVRLQLTAPERAVVVDGIEAQQEDGAQRETAPGGGARRAGKARARAGQAAQLLMPLREL